MHRGVYWASYYGQIEILKQFKNYDQMEFGAAAQTGKLEALKFMILQDDLRPDIDSNGFSHLRYAALQATKFDQYDVVKYLRDEGLLLAKHVDMEFTLAANELASPKIQNLLVLLSVSRLRLKHEPE